MKHLSRLVITVIFIVYLGPNMAKTNDQVSLDLIKDAAGMFNERGYLKSSSFSLDGNEVINNFNGNLMYIQRLDYQPLTQDGIHFDLKICYNGSVGHTSNSGLRRITAGTGDQMNALNLPEWIISANNIAIQTFNFENDPISWSSGLTEEDSISECNNVSALTNGYHSCYKYNNTTANGIRYGTISILMGDGSVKELISVDSGLFDPESDSYFYGFVFKGEYRTMSKDDRSRGYVNAADSTFTLFLDDGTRVTFRFHRPTWKTTITDNRMTNPADSLVMLLPIAFTDQIGNARLITYYCNLEGDLGLIRGRPLVSSAGGWRFYWADMRGCWPSTHMTIEGDRNREYTIGFGHRGDTASAPSLCDESNRGYVSYITDPEGRTTSFSYGGYHLHGLGCRDDVTAIRCEDSVDIYWRQAATTIILNAPRIDTIYYPDGGRSAFSYCHTRSDILTVDYSSYLCSQGGVPPRPCVKSQDWGLYGRDPYFTNMVVSRIRFITNGDTLMDVSKDSLEYWWVDHGLITLPPDSQISALDSFFTERLVARNDLIFPYQDQVKIYDYIYKQHQEDGQYSDLERDRGWVIKLHKGIESDDRAKGHLEKNTIYDWDTRRDGTFQLKNQFVTKDNVTCTTSYTYDWDDNGGTNPLISNMVKKVVTDPWGIRTDTYYNDEHFDISGVGSYYTNSLVDSTMRYSSGSELIEKLATAYYDSQSAAGYPGQARAVTKYFIEAGQVLDSSTEKYEYIRGTDVYAVNNRGLLRKTIEPDGDSVIYHHWEKLPKPDDATLKGGPDDSVQCPVTYYEMKYDGTMDTIAGQFCNGKPFWYKSVSYAPNGADSIERCQKVDDRGNIEKFVGPDRYVSEIAYDGIDRVNRIVLPGGYVLPEFFHTTYSDPMSHSRSVTLDGTAKLTWDTLEPPVYYWNLSNIRNCFSDTLWAIDSILEGNPPHTPPIVHRRECVVLQFDSLYPSGTYIIDSAYLNIYGIQTGSACIGLLLGDKYLCGDEPAWKDSLHQEIVVDIGQNRILLTDLRPAIALVKRGSGCLGVLSSECPDPAKRPRIDVYYRQVNSTTIDSVYSMRNQYDDDTTGGTGLQTTVRSAMTCFPITNRLHFDGFGRVIQHDAVSSDQSYNSVLTTYDYADRVTSRIDQLGNATSHAYDVLDRNVKTTHPDSTPSSSDSTAYSNGNAHSLGLDTLFTMRNSGLYKTTSLDENGHRITEYADVLGRLRLRETSPQAGTTYKTYFDYDDNNNLTTVIKPNGDRVNYRYNSLGWLIKEWAADYDTIFRQYDKNGRQVLYKDGGIKAFDLDAGGPPYHWLYTRYDPLDRVTETGLLAISGADTVFRTSINRFFYDQWGSVNSRGRLSVAYTNENGYNYGEKYDYDARGRLVGQTCYYNPTLDSTLNDSAFVARERQAGRDSTVMVVKKSGDVYYSLQRINSIHSGTYAEIIKRVNGENSVVAVTSNFDMTPQHLIDTMEGTVFCSAGDTIMLFVQIAGPYDPQFTELYAVASYSYYNVYQEYLRDADVDYHLAFAYDLADNLTSITYPDGMVVTYGYDDRGRLATVGDTPNADKYARITYTARDEVQQMILGNDLQTVDYAYNARGWLNTINNGTSASAAPNDLFGQRLYYYGHPDSTNWTAYRNGNIMAQKISMTGTTNETYNYLYDDMDRLDSVGAYSGGSRLVDMHERFRYDRNGNMIALTRGGDAFTFYLTAGKNRLDSLKKAGRTVTWTHFEWDKNGNLTSDDTRHGLFRYDPFNQLDTVLFPATDTALIAFGYNTDGLRVYKDYFYTYLDDCDQGGEPGTKSGGDTLCLYHGRTLTRYLRENIGGKVLAEYSANVMEPPNFKFIYAGDRRIAMYDKTGALHFFLNDHLGSARMVIDSTGVVKDKYKRYFAYGGGASQTVSTGQKYQYTGQPYDDDGAFDLYYYGARYYDPVLGRFTSRDPKAGKYPSWSPYAYTLDNPMRYRDPTGKGIDIIPDICSVVLSAKDFWDDPSWANAGWLAADLVGAIVPFLPAVGIVRHAGKAAKVAEALDKGTDTAKAIDKGADATEGGAKAAKRVVDPSKIETHHRLPTEHKEMFAKAGLNIADYTTPLMAGPHRLKEYNGLHTGANSWNKQWANFFEETPNANKEQILKQLDDMEQKLK